jgi:hypothetical protein
MSDDQHQRVEQVASAIEDLLQMGVIRLREKSESEAMLSPQFAQIVSNVKADVKQDSGSETDQTMKIMYYSLLIHLTENLNVPRSLVMALGNDMEKNRQNMESGELVNAYVTILSQLWARSKNHSDNAPS